MSGTELCMIMLWAMCNVHTTVQYHILMTNKLRAPKPPYIGHFISVEDVCDLQLGTAPTKQTAAQITYYVVIVGT